MSAEAKRPRGRAARVSGQETRVKGPRVSLRFTVNGRGRRVTVPPMKRLLDVLREDCALTGTKEGCGEGECGACSVLLDGAPVNSCLVPAVHCDGRRVETVEGLARDGRLSALQQAFVEMGGAQCGICTPGMLVAAVALIRRAKGRVPGDGEVREALAGNLCRCTGYQKIVDAVRATARAGSRKRGTGDGARRAILRDGTPERPARGGSSLRSSEKSSPGHRGAGSASARKAGARKAGARKADARNAGASTARTRARRATR